MAAAFMPACVIEVKLSRSSARFCSLRIIWSQRRSALSPHSQYLGVPHPEKFAAASILVIGLLNLWVQNTPAAWRFWFLFPPRSSCSRSASSACHISARRSGICSRCKEISGTTGRLRRHRARAFRCGSHRERNRRDETRSRQHRGAPSVTKTSTPALLIVMIEVCVFTALLGLAMHALGGLQIVTVTSTRPARKACAITCCATWVRLCRQRVGPARSRLWFYRQYRFRLASAFRRQHRDRRSDHDSVPHVADREIPKVFQHLNKWGVPSAGMLLATIVPMLLVVFVKDMAGLADLYAVGVVGAIATNLGATSTDRKLLDQILGTHVDVRHLPRHGGDRNVASRR